MKKKRSNVKLQPVKIKQILVPIDFSEFSSNALREAIHIARIFTAKIELIHVVTPVYVTGNETLIPRGDAFYGKLLKQAEKGLVKIAKEVEAREAIKISVKTSLNTVHAAILEHAEKTKTNLIVMGTHGTGGVKEFFAGSNAYRVVSESECPVLTVQKRTARKGFKKIVLPLRTELNSRQKVNLVATLAKAFMSEIIIAGYTDGKNESEARKIALYANQVEKFLNKEAIACSKTFINDKNFTKAIIDHAKKHKADLVAVMTNHDFSLSQILNGPYAQQFVNHSPIPVLSVPNTLQFEYRHRALLSMPR
jgi:nucleotide-binding universal stress UspA family protein